MPPRIAVAVLVLLAFLVGPSESASAADVPTGFRDDVVFAGLEEPTSVRFADDGRVFVAEKPGRVLVYEDLGDSAPTVFADLRTQVYDRNDKGLLGLALDPDFPAQPYVYLLYTYDHILGDPGGAPKWGEPDHSGDVCPKPAGTGVDDCPVSGRLVRLTAAGGGDQASEAGGEVEQEVLVEGWCQQFSSHSVGDLQFDAGGALYASGGEGGDANGVDYGQAGWPQVNQCGDPPAGIGGVQSPPTAEGGALRAQDARTPASPFDPTGLSGSLIRIDPDTGEGLPGNPLFASADANERRLVAYGLRNPFRFVLDPDGERAYVGNVGWSKFEEIDEVPLGSDKAFNSGWPCYEGPGPNAAYESLGLTLCEGLYAEPAAATAPFFHYRHGHQVVPDDECPLELGSAVSGIEIYDGGSFPSAYDGALFFADPVRGCIYSMMSGDGGKPDPLTAAPFMTGGSSYPGVDLEIGPGGDLYYVSLFGEDPFGGPYGPGSVHRISYDPDAPRARLSSDRRWGEASAADPLQVQLDASASTSTRAEPLDFEWDLDGDGVFEVDGGETQTASFGEAQNVTVAVRVSDSGGASTDRLTLYPGDTPPQPSILSPEADLTWEVGQEIEFHGSAVDAEDGGVGALSLFWRTRLYHCPSNCHVHPLQAFPSTAAGSLVAPNHDYPSHIELALTAVDSRGLTATTAIQLYPRAVDLTIASDPPGLNLSAGLLTLPAPFVLTAIEGGEVVLSAPLEVQFGGSAYRWRDWSDGGDRVHAVEAEGDGVYTASYAPEGAPPSLPPAEEPPGRGDPSPTPGPGGGQATPPLGPPERSAGTKPRVLLGLRPPRRTAGRTARFSFDSSLPGARFRCKLNGSRFKPCRSPRVYRGLKPGPQVFRVYAIVAGAKGKPRAFRWRVL